MSRCIFSGTWETTRSQTPPLALESGRDKQADNIQFQIAAPPPGLLYWRVRGKKAIKTGQAFWEGTHPKTLFPLQDKAKAKNPDL